MKLSTILMLAFVTLTLISTAGFYTSFRQSENIAIEIVQKDAIVLAMEIADKIDQFIYHHIENFKTYSKYRLLRQEIMRSNEEFEHMQSREASIALQDEAWKNAPKDNITSLMKDLLDNDLSKELKGRKDFLEKEHGHAIYGEIFVTNKYGVIVGLTGRTSDYLQSDEEWWQKTMKEGLFIKDIGYDESAGIYAVNLHLRIDNESGEPIGVLKAVLSIDEIINMLEDIGNVEEHKIEGRYFWVISEEGVLIVSTDPRAFFTTEKPEQFSSLKDTELFRGLTEERGIMTIAGHEDGGEEERLAYSRTTGYMEFKSLRWIIIVENKGNVFFEAINALETRTGIIALCVIILSIIVGIATARIVSNNLKKITFAVDEISKGNFYINLQKGGIEEVNALIDSMSRIMITLKISVLRTKGVEQEEKSPEISGKEATDKIKSSGDKTGDTALEYPLTQLKKSVKKTLAKKRR
ncbi:MAG TPA: cache domain-containing protein [Candidatus Nanoarchaeia archaeon]|nr:cache domain-containing protein [Candidatus Nanoarchaeia archaeon]